MSADGAMSRAEAVAELRRRYRVRFVVEVEHAGRRYGARGATMAETGAEVEPAAVEVLRVLVGRALAQLDGPAEA